MIGVCWFKLVIPIRTVPWQEVRSIHEEGEERKSYLVYSQICINHLVDDQLVWLHHNIKKKIIIKINKSQTYSINLHLIHTPIWIMRRWPEVEKVEVRQKGKWRSWMGHSLTLWTAMVELAPSLTFTFLSESSFRVGQLWMLVRPFLGLVSFQVFRSSPCTTTCFVLLLMMMGLGPRFFYFFS